METINRLHLSYCETIFIKNLSKSGCGDSNIIILTVQKHWNFSEICDICRPAIASPSRPSEPVSPQRAVQPQHGGTLIGEGAQSSAVIGPRGPDGDHQERSSGLQYMLDRLDSEKPPMIRKGHAGQP